LEILLRFGVHCSRSFELIGKRRYEKNRGSSFRAGWRHDAAYMAYLAN
jgi:hypothetical protein